MGCFAEAEHRTSADNQVLGHATMSAVSHGLTVQEEEFQRLAEDLATETSAKAILQFLPKLFGALDAEVAEGGNLPPAFLLAGGVPTVIRLLQGNPTADAAPDAVRRNIAMAAGACLDRVTYCCAGKHTVLPAKLVPALTSALRDAPHIIARMAAAKAMVSIAASEAEQRRAMAEGGVIGLVLAFLLDAGDDFEDVDKFGAVWVLARDLVCWEMAAVREIRRAMCTADADLAFMAVQVLMVRYSCFQTMCPNAMRA